MEIEAMARGGAREGAGRPKGRPGKTVYLDAEVADRVRDLLQEMPPTELLFRLEMDVEALAAQVRESWERTEELATENDRLRAEVAELTAKLEGVPVEVSPEAIAPEPEVMPEETWEDDGSGLSIYQQKILAAIRDRLSQEDKHGLLIEALAGCGKSFTLVQVGKVLAASGLSSAECRFVVFGTKNKADLESKMNAEIGVEWGSSVQTLHALSRSILASSMRLDVKKFKYSDIAKKLGFISRFEYGSRVPGDLNRGENPDIESDHEFLDLIEKLRLYCLDPTQKNVAFLVKKHRIGVSPAGIENVTRAASKCLEEGVNLGLMGQIDFTDMSWLLWKCRDRFQGAIAGMKRDLKFVAIDEAQDTDQLQIEVLGLLVDPSQSFLCAVGDRYQAVYNFRGCLADGLDKIAQTFQCDSLPLPINYRCGKAHLEFVRELFPYIQIQPHQGAHEGEIRCIREANFLSIFDNPEGDYFGICRRNAPLLKYAIWLLSNNLPAKIKDKSLGTKLVGMVKEIMPRYRADDFITRLAEWENEQRRKYQPYPDAEQRIGDVQDRVEAIGALFEAYSPTSLDEWETAISRIFDESGHSTINLYTIHSGKGGEGNDTFILSPQSMPIRHKKQTTEELEQEYNLLYVALTRAKENLWIVVENSNDGEPNWPEWLPDRLCKFWGEEDNPLANTPDLNSTEWEDDF